MNQANTPHALMRLALFGILATAAASAPRAHSISPSETEVPYGKDARQVLDFWRANRSTPGPLLLNIHGGGWNSLDKRRMDGVDLKKILEAGISVVSIEYRFVSAAQKAGVTPPVKWPLEDAARALQFVRSKAAEWNIDPHRIVASGTSAGGCSSLWLAFHDDLAKPLDPDPIARLSTRVYAVVANQAQTSLDPAQMRAWLPHIDYGQRAFGSDSFAQYFANREKLLPWIQEYSPYHLASADDPPAYLFYNTAPAENEDAKTALHSAHFGVELHKRLQALGVQTYLHYPDSPSRRYANLTDCIIKILNTQTR